MKIDKLFGASPPPPTRGVTITLSVDEAVRLRRVLRHYGNMRRANVLMAFGVSDIVQAIGDDGTYLSVALDKVMGRNDPTGGS